MCYLESQTLLRERKDREWPNGEEHRGAFPADVCFTCHEAWQKICLRFRYQCSMIGCSDSSYGPAAVIFSPRAPAFIAGALNDRNPLHSSHFGRRGGRRQWVESGISSRPPKKSSTQIHQLQPAPAARYSPLPARSRQITSNRHPHQNATFTPTVMLRPINGAAFLMKLVCAYANRSVRLLAFR